MSRIAYVNGRYVPMRDAMVHVEDRGYQFADGVYEVCEVRGGRLIDERRHLDRLQRSLGELRIRMPHSRAAIAPSLVVTARRLDKTRNEALAAKGIAVISVPENRWGRVDIKTVGLLPNVLARQTAIDQGAGDAWFVDKAGFVTEASSANAWIVTDAGKLITRHADHTILHGITRSVVLYAVKEQNIAVEQRAFTLDEAYQAREAFITSASQIVLPVVSLNGQTIGDGKPGPIATELRRAFHGYAEAE